MFIFLLLGAALVVYVIMNLKGSKIVTTDEYYQQAGIKVDFKTGKITIDKHVYDVNQVTGLRRNITTDRGTFGQPVGEIEISVDDFKKPIHRVLIGGGRKKTDECMQRLCVAIRKAGGPSFT